MKLYLLPYKRGSMSARELTQVLNTKRIKLNNSRFNHRTTRLVVNWGNSSIHPNVNYDRVLNHFMIAVGSSGYNGPLKTIQEMMCNATTKRYCRRR